MRHCVHVDNVGVFGGGRKVVEETMDRLVGSFESRGLKTHELEITEGEIEALGVTLDATRRHTRLTAASGSGGSARASAGSCGGSA